MMPVPFIPPTAPFSPEQRAWLNGYFVGFLSHAHLEAPPSAAAVPAPPLEPLLILFGSQTGSAELLARGLGKEAAAHGFAATVRELNSSSPAELAQLKRLVIVTSTWGDGDPPDNAAQFWAALSASTTPLPELGFAVLALGDRNYSDFCGAGRKFDERLAALGATRWIDRGDCDTDYESAAKTWTGKFWSAIPKPVGSGASASVVVVEEVPAKNTGPTELVKSGGWSRQNPFPAPLVANRLLNGAGSAKETRHFEFSLEGSGLTYEPGDALGVLPENCSDLVSEIIATGGWRADERVRASDGQEMSLVAALLRKCDIRKPTSALLDALAKADGCEAFARFLAPENKDILTAYLAEREVIDTLLEYPSFRPGAAEFVAMLGRLQPRLYSISSSLKAFPNQVHLTVAIVRYSSGPRSRKGVCSSFLADRVPSHSEVPIFIQTSHGFRLPADPATPVIMVGPGTGIAPFRAFLHERRATGATGRNWLFFGDQQASCDFLYREELDELRGGPLSRLDTAFSRDQSEKVYVQNRMLQNAAELWRWLEEGAHFYVCGDAKRMARDVDAALHQVIASAGKSPEQATEYIQSLKAQKRYQRDVY